MKELQRCKVCRSLTYRDQIDGACKICKVQTCPNCKRECDRCHEIVCMFDIETKVVMRQQKPNLHKLCPYCSEVWQ